MKTSSAKAKGRRLQDEIRAAILKGFPYLGEDDVKCAIMGEGGRDIHLSPLAQRFFPFSIEAKNQERINLWKAIEQAEENAGELTPLLVFRRNRTKARVVLDFDVFMEMAESHE